MTESTIGVCNVVKKCFLLLLFTAWVAWAESLLNGRLWDPKPERGVLWGYPFNNSGDIVPLIASNALKLAVSLPLSTATIPMNASLSLHQLTMESACLILSRNMKTITMISCLQSRTIPKALITTVRQVDNFAVTGGRHCKLSLCLFTAPPVTTKLSTWRYFFSVSDAIVLS